MIQHRGYQVLIEPNAGGDGLTGRVVMPRDVVTFTAPDMTRLRREAESAIEFYLESCEQAGRQPDKPDGRGFLTIFAPEDADAIASLARKQKTSPERVIEALVRERLADGGGDAAT